VTVSGMKPVIFGFAGLSLTTDENAFFADAKPFGFILFQRNISDPGQVMALIKDLREATGRADVPVFIDQEGGRVARLKPPHWPSLPALRVIGRLYEEDKARALNAMRIHARLTARRLFSLGISGNCSPVLDLFIESACEAIGDRAFSRDPAVVAALGRVAMETFLSNGVLPVIKHLPGHGRVMDDPHEKLPAVDCPRAILEAEDFRPFKALRDAPIGMNCHVIFNALDPDAPVSLSARVHCDIIRGVIGFQGLLMSDDIAMKAMKGALPETARKALSAGADIVLHCSGELQEMREVADALPKMGEAALARWNRAKAMVHVPTENFDEARERLNLDVVLQSDKY
jgi:beta-N-acetylhexosaminidase